MENKPIIRLGQFHEADQSEVCCGDPEQVLFTPIPEGEPVLVLDVETAREDAQTLLDIIGIGRAGNIAAINWEESGAIAKLARNAKHILAVLDAAPNDGKADPRD